MRGDDESEWVWTNLSSERNSDEEHIWESMCRHVLERLRSTERRAAAYLFAVCQFLLESLEKSEKAQNSDLPQKGLNISQNNTSTSLDIPWSTMIELLLRIVLHLLAHTYLLMRWFVDALCWCKIDVRISSNPRRTMHDSRKYWGPCHHRIKHKRRVSTTPKLC